MALKPSELITKLVGDLPRGEVPDLRVLHGFLGPGRSKGRWRLYSTLGLDRYVEFAKKDVLHHQMIRSSRGYPDAMLVWLYRDADLTYVPERSQEEKEAAYFSPETESAVPPYPEFLWEGVVTHRTAVGRPCSTAANYPAGHNEWRGVVTGRGCSDPRPLW